MGIDRTDKAQAQEIIDLLCMEFKVRKPNLDWSMHSRNGRYFKRYYRLVCGPHAWRGVVNCLLHEFAHHVNYLSNPLSLPHSKSFHSILTKVVIAWYGNVREYSWSTEYRSMRGPSRNV